MFVSIALLTDVTTNTATEASLRQPSGGPTIETTKPANPVQRFLREANASVWALIVANTIPLFGVLLFRWHTGVILAIYWAENLVVGFYNILKLALSRGDKMVGSAPKLFLVPFFCLHFGGFCAVHGVFILVLGQGGLKNKVDVFPDFHAWPGPLIFIGVLVGVVGNIWKLYGSAMLLPFIGLMISHGVSFVENFLLKGEIRKQSMVYFMMAPYGRIVITHVALITAALPVMMLGSPLPLLIILVLLKIAADVTIHKFSHREFKLGGLGVYASFANRFSQFGQQDDRKP